MAYSRDLWLPGIEITAANNGFTIGELTSTSPVIYTLITGTVAAGTYYLHDDASMTAAGYPSLYAAIGAALTAAGSAATWAWSTEAAKKSPKLPYGGLVLTSDTSYRLYFGAGEFTMDASWFGFLSAENTSQPSTTVGSTEVIISPYTVNGRWISHSLLDGVATDKQPDRYRNVKFSSPRISDATTVTWDTGTHRRMLYEYVPAAHIYPARANEYEYAHHGELGHYDANNGWLGVWESLARLDDVLLVHNACEDLQVDSHDYEVVRMREERQAERLSAVAKRMGIGGDYYEIDVDLYVVSGSYDH